MTTVLLLALAAISLWQLVLGCSPAVLFLSVATGLVALVPVVVYGSSHIVGAVFILVAVFFSFAGLVAKSVLAQPIDLYLFQPFLSFTIAFFGVASFSAGALAAAPLAKRMKGILRPVNNPGELRVMALIALGVGLASSVLVFRLGEGMLANASRFFSPLTTLGIVCETARTIIISKGRRTISPISIASIVVVLALSLAGNSKLGFILAGAAYFTTCIAYRGIGPVLPKLILAALAYYFLEKYVFTAIHLARGERTYVDALQLLNITIDNIFKIATGDPLILARIAEGNFAYAYYSNPLLYTIHYFTDYPVPIGAIDRFMLVPFIDSIVRYISFDGPFLGLHYILGRLPDVLPSVLLSAKDYTAPANFISWSLKLVSEDVENYLTITMPAELFIYGGIGAIVTIAPIAHFVMTLILGVSSPKLPGNVFAIYLLVAFGSAVPANMLLGTEFLVIRTIPTNLVILYLLVMATRFMLKRRRGRPEAVVRSEIGGTPAGRA